MKKIILPLMAAAMMITTMPARADDSAFCPALLDMKTYTNPKYKLDAYKYLVPGLDGYVFRTSSDIEPDYVLDDKALQNIIRVRDYLRKNNTELVIALVPSRGVSLAKYIDYKQNLTKNFKPEVAMTGYKAFIDKMRSGGLNVAAVTDFSPFTDAEPFAYRRDHHWTYFGANATAKQVATIVKALPVYATLPKEAFKTEVRNKINYDGVFNMRIEKVCGKAPPAEEIHERLTSPVNDETNEAALLGDKPTPEVLLLGTSNSTRLGSYSNFEGSLKEELGVDIFNASVTGGGVDTSFLDFTGSETYKAKKPKLIIWEFPAYYNLKSGTELGRQFYEFAASGKGVCTGAEVIANETIKLDKDIVAILKDAAAKGIAPLNYSIHLEFDKPLNKDITLISTIGTGDTAKRERYKFDRNAVYKTADSLHLVLIPPKAKGDYTAFALQTPKEMMGQSVNITLCKDQ
jgi:alginate biosynthesis protein AlgX